MRVKLKR